MDERVIANYGGDIEKVNVYPKAKKSLLKKYAHLWKKKDHAENSQDVGKVEVV